MKLAFSPCPNDTFLFHAFVKKKTVHPFECSVTLKDIQDLNELALEGDVDVCKVSCGILDLLKDTYQILPVGSAVGFNNGPKIVSQASHPCSLQEAQSIAIPGKLTTANKLVDLFFPDLAQKVYCLYDEVANLVRTGETDLGCIIHETRFTMAEQGLKELADMGELWHQQTEGLPLPLGTLVAKRSLGTQVIRELTQALQSSLEYAWAHPTASTDYVLKNSIEKDPKIVSQHIDLYVNQTTHTLSAKAKHAFNYLMDI